MEQLRGELTENSRETSEELMEKYFEGEEFTEEEFVNGIREGIRMQLPLPRFWKRVW